MREAKLNDAQVKQLADSGLIEIGSHTLTHANLNKLSDADCLRELTDSKQQLEQLKTRDQFCISIWDLFRPRCQTGKTVRV